MSESRLPALRARAAEELEGWTNVCNPYEDKWFGRPPGTRLVGAIPVPDYPADLNAVRRLEMEIANRGLWCDYIEHLRELVVGEWLWEQRITWEIATAPADVRFAAVCAVCGWEGNDDQ